LLLDIRFTIRRLSRSVGRIGLGSFKQEFNRRDGFFAYITVKIALSCVKTALNGIKAFNGVNSPSICNLQQNIRISLAFCGPLFEKRANYT
jgi:hypothetical protein